MQRLTSTYPPDAAAPIPIESRALSTLAFIRTSIESSTAIVVPGMAAIVMGAIGLAAAALAARWPGRWLEIWMLAGGAGFGLGGAIVARQITRRGGVRYLGPAKKFLLCLCPVLLAAALLTLVLWVNGLPSALPGLWLLLYGCALLSASTVMSARITRLVGTMGALFGALGIATFALPSGWHTLTLGAGFGGLHLVYGLRIRRVGHAE